MKLTFPALSKINKTWLVLGAALAVGLLAAIVTRSFLSTQVAEIEARNQHQTLDIVVAKADLAQNTVLSSKNVAVRKIPVAYAHSGAVAPSEFERIDGGALAFPVKAGEMIMWSQMEGKRAPTFSARLAEGRRAITVVVDEINSISGMLEPGDLIDLMFSVDHNGRKVVLPLLQGMRVMATGQRSVDDPKGGEPTQFATVTLDVTRRQASNIILARDTGKLTALLRNPSDQPPIGEPDPDLAFLSDAGSTARVAAPRRYIPVLYGGASYSPDALHLQHGAPAPASAAPPTSTPAPAPAPAAGPVAAAS